MRLLRQFLTFYYFFTKRFYTHRKAPKGTKCTKMHQKAQKSTKTQNLFAYLRFCACKEKKIEKSLQ